MVKVFDVIRVTISDMAALRIHGPRLAETDHLCPRPERYVIVVNQGKDLVAFGKNTTISGS
jgi:hypothetical protein